MKRRLAPYAVGRSRRSDESGGVALQRERRLKEKAACAAYADAVGRSRRSDESGGVALQRERRLKEKAACAAYADKVGYVQGERCRLVCTLSPHYVRELVGVV